MSFQRFGFRELASGAVAIVIVTLAGMSVNAAQSPSVSKADQRPKPAPRTPDGQPDLQGVWSFATVTPLERPKDLAGKQTFTDEEAANFAERENRRQNRDLIDPKKGGLNYAPESQGGVVPYNEFWYDRGTKVVATKRTSLIVDPPDGRIPPLTAEAQKRAAARAEARRRGRTSEDTQTGLADGPADRGVGERCIVGFNSGPPMLSAAYNNNVQLFQARDYVVILSEMIHSARVVPLDGRPHLPQNVRQLVGDSRGRWEGETLVVETTNFTDKTSFRGSSEHMRLIERFTRVDPDTVVYEFTVDDPTTFTKAWTAQVPMPKVDGLIYEYACHEGNHGIVGVLAGARARERAEAAAKKEK